MKWLQVYLEDDKRSVAILLYVAEEADVKKCSTLKWSKEDGKYEIKEI